MRERKNLLEADEVMAPSRAIAYAINRIWRVSRSRISLVPLAFEPSPELLNISVGTDSRRITYIGRLELRKGVQDLASAIPLVLRREPEARCDGLRRYTTSAIAPLQLRSYERAIKRRMAKRGRMARRFWSFQPKFHN
jgi:glycosyltransferase involved in cell wall biosynthesis